MKILLTAVLLSGGVLAGCSSIGLGIGLPLGPFSLGVGVGSGGFSAGIGTGVGPVGLGVGVNQRGQVSGGVGVGAGVPIGSSNARVGVGVGAATVLYDPNRTPGAPVVPQAGAAGPRSAGEQIAP